MFESSLHHHSWQTTALLHHHTRGLSRGISCTQGHGQGTCSLLWFVSNEVGADSRASEHYKQCCTWELPPQSAPALTTAKKMSLRWKAPHLASLVLSRTAEGAGTTQHQSRLWHGSEISVENILEHTQSLVKLLVGERGEKKERSRTTLSNDSYPAILQGQRRFFFFDCTTSAKAGNMWSFFC